MAQCATCGEAVGPMLDEEGFMYVARCRCGPGDPADGGASPHLADPARWLTGQDYTLVVFSAAALRSGHRGAPLSFGRYQLWTRQGRGSQGKVTHHGPYEADYAEFLTLNTALADLRRRVTAAGRTPDRYTLAVYSCRPSVIQQLAGQQPCRTAVAVQACDRTVTLLAQFRAVALYCREGTAIPALFGL